MNRRSLTWRLSILVALVTIVMAGGAGAWAYAESLQSARDLQDDVLAQVASIASATIVKGAVPVDDIPLSDKLADIDVTSLKKARLPASTPDGFGVAQIGGEARRTFVIRTSTGPRLVVSQSIEVRDLTARGSAVATVTPLLLLLPALLLAIYLVARNVLRPVNTLAEHVNARAATDLSPLNVEQAPEELRGFVAALNSQFDRVSQASGLPDERQSQQHESDRSCGECYPDDCCTHKHSVAARSSRRRVGGVPFCRCLTHRHPRFGRVIPRFKLTRKGRHHHDSSANPSGDRRSLAVAGPLMSGCTSAVPPAILVRSATTAAASTSASRLAAWSAPAATDSNPPTTNTVMAGATSS
jgi:hypothetical protein